MSAVPEIITDEAAFLTFNMLWSSLNEVTWFVAGFMIFRLALWAGIIPSKLGPSFMKPKGTRPAKNTSVESSPVSQAICRDSAAGNYESILASWQLEKEKTHLSGSALQAVSQALLKLDSASLTEELTDYFSRHPSRAKAHTVNSIVGELLRGGHAHLAKDFLAKLQAEKLTSAIPLRSLDAVVAAFASQADVESVKELLAAWDNESWGSGANAAVRGFVKSRQPELALEQLAQLQHRGLQLQAATASGLFASITSPKVGISLGRLLESLKGFSIPAEPLAGLMQTCLTEKDMETARALDSFCREQKLQLTFAISEPLLKLAAKKDEAWAMALFQEMQEKSMFLSEGLCGSVMASCGEPRHIQLAEAIQKHLRDRKMTSLATYKTLMKVYATCNLLEKACNIYEDILADEIKPDQVMINCLLKFALKIGRNDLSQRVFSQGGYDSNSVLWLIRAAGQQGDLKQVFSLLQEQESKGAVAAALYNSVLDICMTHGTEDQVQELFVKMRSKNLVTLVTFNTLMKGYSAKNDFQKAHALLKDIKSCGLTPDSASYNCLIGAAVAQGNHDSAWAVFNEMGKAGLEPDNFTLSIVMKIVRKTANRQEAQRGMAVLDNCHFKICEDEVLVNTVLDACIHLRDIPRLKWVVSEIQRAKMIPSVQNYGLIIKAYACLKDIDRCWALWQQMTKDRGLVPSDVALSCMLDAMVSAGQVEAAIELFREWRSLVPPNTIIFSNLIKGFAARGDADGAMKMFEELKEAGLQMNLVAYSTLVDAQAKSGNVEKAMELMSEMRRDGIEPNTITYSSLLKGLCMKGDLDQGLKVFKEMASLGLHPDTVMFNTLLDGAVRCSRFSLCDQVIEEMKATGVEASNFTTSIVVKMWGRRRKLEKAEQTVREAAWAGKQQLDSKLCTCLLSACFHNNSPMRALELLQEFKTWPNCDGADSSTYEHVVENLMKTKLLKEAVEVAMEASQLAACHASLRPLSLDVLRSLQVALERKGAEKLFAPLQRYLQRSNLPHP